MLVAAMEAFVLRSVRNRSRTCLTWLVDVLGYFSRSLLTHDDGSVADSGSCPGLWSEVLTDGGVLLALVLHYYRGAACDLTRLHDPPRSEAERVANIDRVMVMLHAVGCHVVIDVDECRTGVADDDMMLLQVPAACVRVCECEQSRCVGVAA
jgi:hypothetical protein